jgi:hypothetical protein
MQGWITWLIGIVAVLATVGWAAAWATIKDLIKNAKELEADYKKGMADGTLTDAEMKECVPHLVSIIEDSAKLWQTLINLWYKLLPFLKKPSVKGKVVT